MRRFSWGELAFNLVIVGGVTAALIWLLWPNDAVPRPVLALLPLLALAIVAFRMRRWWRRLMAPDDVSPAIRQALERKVGFYRALSDDQRRAFRRAVQFFLLDQNIVGVGIAVDDELRALVAASATILSFGMPDYTWDATRDILIYPDAFDEDYSVGHGKTRLGQVGRQGPVIFSARALRAGFARGADGHNVGLHEFAHVLDFEDGEIDGMPAHLDWPSIRPWLDEMTRLMKLRDKQGRHGQVLRDYGYTNEAEFFACATEMFFEQPERLERRAPNVYQLLARFYRQRPATPVDAD